MNTNNKKTLLGKLQGNLQYSTDFVTVAVPLLAGSHKGYCDAKGISYYLEDSFSKENINITLTYGPTLLSTFLGGVSGFFASKKYKKLEEFSTEYKSNIPVEISGTILSSLTSGSLAAVLTMLGYCVGYMYGRS